MFGTLRYDAQNDDTHFIERTTDPLNGKGEGQRPRYSACDKCRAKKVCMHATLVDAELADNHSRPKQRCGGRRDGCERCIRTSSECVYSLQGKGRGRRRRNVTKGKDFSLEQSPLDPEKRSTANEPQQRQNPAPGETTQEMQDFADDTMSRFLPVNNLDNDLTSGLMQREMLPGFDGQNIDDFLNSTYTSTLPAHNDFDPDYYFASHCEALENTPVDSLSDISSVFEHSQLLQSGSDFDLNSWSPFSSLQSHSDDSPSRHSTPYPDPSTPGTKAHQKRETPPIAFKENCQCLSTMVILLEDLENQDKHVNTVALDSILLSHKEALSRCKSVLSCSNCYLRPEYILLLRMVTERLVSLCESTVTKYLDNMNDNTPFSETMADRRYLLPTEDVKVRVGAYEIETADELVGMARLLIVMQLQSLKKFIEGVAIAIASRGEGKTQGVKVQAAEQRLAKLIQRIRQP